jgi:hypothetical protein
MPDLRLTEFSQGKLRISLRAMLILVIVVGGGLGWVTRRAEVQREAVSTIKRTGAGVLYDWQFKNGILNPKREHWAPKWLVDRIGVDFFGNVVYVGASTRNVDDSVLTAIGRLKSLERLDLVGSAITDAGLVNLEGLTHLRSLDLAATDVGDAGLAHLKRLRSIKFLNLNATKVGDVGLGHLSDLTSLRTLLLGGTKVTDAGLPHVHRLYLLELLNLVDTDITDMGLAELKPLISLRHLGIGNTLVSDAGLPQLGSLPKLDSLSFHSNISNKMLRVTNAGLKELEIALPKLTIDY